MVQVAAAIIRNEKGEILICQRGAGGSCAFLWEFPGGKQECGETLAQCLARECKEELAIDIVPESIFDEADFVYPERTVKITFFNVRMTGGSLRMDVHEKLRWVRPEALKAFAFCPADVEVVKKLAGAAAPAVSCEKEPEDMSQTQRQVFERLDALGISYEVLRHPAVFTIDEMDRLQASGGEVVKNLFLRDDKKKRYFLVTLQKEKKADLERLQVQLGSRRLCFASDRDLQRYLGLLKGAVSPLGVLNDTARVVEVVIDRDVRNFPRIGVHPNENTATVWIDPMDMEAVLRAHGNALVYVEL